MDPIKWVPWTFDEQRIVNPTKKPTKKSVLGLKIESGESDDMSDLVLYRAPSTRVAMDLLGNYWLDTRRPLLVHMDRGSSVRVPFIGPRRNDLQRASTVRTLMVLRRLFPNWPVMVDQRLADFIGALRLDRPPNGLFFMEGVQ